MTLDLIKKGQSFKINHISNETIRAQAIRFGITEGQWLTCDEVVPAGPIVIRQNRQQIALGRQLAREINISLAD
ncbi:FeoA family protein [Desulforamulus hydrothermalis]|uniref:FeoA family protein n=1 Tax=Desulforamulus hydrothermalis Lam5 = DSM 18033 TaxID=1121428 RepID=K8DZW0_9FIRM|nr:ferrous iron transport protein A [Desulforamulus hydrothermalis]CCO08709.1 FeoA family protein [Desulforamulus hydrothermalis Lam5 = DSM 18033]SHG69732.1 Fe2+ transport system protein FeoA [Desulforamulus hydrothermalis Lam5 = DSM 18033]